MENQQTSATCRWSNLNWTGSIVTTAACCDVLAGFLDFGRREKGLRLYAWVIMENHFHAIV